MRTLAVMAMAVALLVGVTPVRIAYADTVTVATAEELKNALQDATDGADIDVTADFTIDASGVSGNGLTLPAGVSVSIRSSVNKTITATSSGAAFSSLFQIGSGQTLTLGEGLVIDGNDTARLADVQSGGALVMRGATFTRGKNSARGGAIYASGGTIDLLDGAKITNCLARIGGALYVTDAATVNLCPGAVIDTCDARAIDGSSAFGAGGIHVDGKSTFTMTGGTISNCYSNYVGGGVFVDGDSTFTMTGGTITGCSTLYYGGAIYVTSPESYFVLDGGTLSENTASSGGGLYVGNTTNVMLLSGYIERNQAKKNPSYPQYSYGTGGGICVASISSEVTSGFHMQDVLITDNTSGTIGGGAWLCPTGDVDSEISDGVAMWGNTAGHAGDDLALVTNQGSHSADVIQNRMLGGGINTRYYDGNASTTGDLYSSGDGSGVRYRDGRRDIFDYDAWQANYEATGTHQSITLHNEPGPAPNSDPSKGALISEDEAAAMGADARTLAEERARLYIRGNTAEGAGGGIASNGHVWVGREESKSVVVTKSWSLPEGASAEAAVTVYLEIEDYNSTQEHRIEKVELNAANNWTHTFEGLPPRAKVNLEEAALSSGGWVAYYVESNQQPSETSDGYSFFAEEDVAVYNARAGRLEISKRIDGDLADPEQEFTYEVSILEPTTGAPYEVRDSTGHPAAMDFAYTGSRTGTLASGVGTITLKGGESVVIENIPHGAVYSVSETPGTADGYEILPVRTVDGVAQELHDEDADQGTIVGDTATHIAYTNIRSSNMGSIQVSKAVTGDAADPSQVFHFELRLYHPDGTELREGEFAFVGDEEGIVGSGHVFPLRDGESVRIDGIPTGTRWTVREVVADAHGYEIEPVQGDVRGEDAETGVIASGQTAQLSYTNERTSAMGQLAIAKTVAVGDGTEREFEFRVRFFDAAGTAVNEAGDVEFAYTGSREGLIASGDTLTLAAGDRVVVEGLPEGMGYQVEELVPAGWSSESTGASGTVVAHETGEASFVNTYVGQRVAGTIPATGDAQVGARALAFVGGIIVIMGALRRRVG